MLKLSSVKADLDTEANGETIPFKPWPGVSFTVRSTMCQTYQVARAKLVQKWAAREDSDAVSPHDAAADIGRLLCDTILLGWDGIVDDNGKPIPFTREKALEILCDEAFREVRNAVEFCASKVAAITPKFEAAAAKN